MNYINNANNMCVCGFNENDNIEIKEDVCFIDNETGKELLAPVYSSCKPFVDGKLYKCKVRYLLVKGYYSIGTYDTKEEAEKAYNKMITELKDKGNTVIDI